MSIAPVVEFRPVSPKGASLHAHLGDGFIVPTSAGGWSATARPRHTSISQYVGRDPITMDIPILFDGLAHGESQNKKITHLYRLMQERVGARDEPRVLVLHGFPVPFSGKHWVINNITPGPEIRRSSDGHRVQAQFTVNVLEYVPGDVTVKGSPAKHHKQSKKGDGDSSNGKVRHYTVKKGDTLKKIAVHFYGKASDWHIIAKANSIRDPDHVKVGAKLKIPAHD